MGGIGYRIGQPEGIPVKIQRISQDGTSFDGKLRPSAKMKHRGGWRPEELFEKPSGSKFPTFGILAPWDKKAAS